MSNRVRGYYTGSFEFENQILEFTAIVWGKPYHFPERRVPGNPCMIESFEENGVDIEDFDLDELYISGTQVNLAGYDISKHLEDEIFGELEDHEDDIEWEFGE